MAGITRTTVEVRAGGSFQSVGFSMEYAYDQPVDPDDTGAVVSDLTEKGSTLAIQGLRDHLSRLAAEGHPDAQKSPLVQVGAQASHQQAAQPAQPAAAQPAQPAQPQQPAAPAQPAQAQPQQPQAASPQPQQPYLAQGQKPNNAGGFSYPPTQFLDSDGLVGQVKQGIEQAGYNPDEFVVFDNRPDLEQGKASWSFCNVKAGQNTAWEQAIGKRAAFYVDANDPSSVSVKPTKTLSEATA